MIIRERWTAIWGGIPTWIRYWRKQVNRVATAGRAASREGRMNDAMQSAPWAITPQKVEQAVQRLVAAARPRKVILFGSYVRGETHRDSDLDLLVVTDNAVANVRKESARLRHALRGIRLCVDVLAARECDFNRLKDKIGLIYREAFRHGTVVYEAGQGV